MAELITSTRLHCRQSLPWHTLTTRSILIWPVLDGALLYLGLFAGVWGRCGDANRVGLQGRRTWSELEYGVKRGENVETTDDKSIRPGHWPWSFNFWTDGEDAGRPVNSDWEGACCLGIATIIVSVFPQQYF